MSRDFHQDILQGVICDTCYEKLQVKRERIHTCYACESNPEIGLENSIAKAWLEGVYTNQEVQLMCEQQNINFATIQAHFKDLHNNQ